jgi:hypothetical protein
MIGNDHDFQAIWQSEIADTIGLGDFRQSGLIALRLRRRGRLSGIGLGGWLILSFNGAGCERQSQRETKSGR